MVRIPKDIIYSCLGEDFIGENELISRAAAEVRSQKRSLFRRVIDVLVPTSVSIYLGIEALKRSESIRETQIYNSSTGTERQYLKLPNAA